MKKDKLIELTQIIIEETDGWAFLNPPTRYKAGELKTFINTNKISSFTRVNPKNEKITIFKTLFYNQLKPINLNLEPYTYLDIVGGKYLLVKETPEVIKKLIEKTNP